jgi:hypothetical protein
MAPKKTRKASEKKGANETQGQNCAVINPYALAKLIAEQRIPWNQLPDVPSVLEQLLATPSGN